MKNPTAVSVYEALRKLEEDLADFKRFFEEDRDFDIKVNALWTAKDVLGHITFWHESFARVLKALVANEKPTLLKGKIPEINQQGFQLTHSESIVTLLEWLNLAQKTITTHIANPNLELIPYRKGSRSYTPVEHLEIVGQHIRSHLKKLRKVYKSKA